MTKLVSKRYLRDLDDPKGTWRDFLCCSRLLDGERGSSSISSRLLRLSRPVAEREPLGGKNQASMTAARAAAAMPCFDPPSFAINRTESNFASRALLSTSNV